MSDWSEATSSERFACLVATCAQAPGDGIAEELVLDSGSERPEAVVGTLDLCAVRAMPGEVLIGAFGVQLWGCRSVMVTCILVVL